MTGWELLKAGWDWEPSVVGGAPMLLGGYLAAVRFRRDRKTLLFAAGVVVMFLALVSPLDVLSDNYLFSAHMLQHILLDLMAPLLFVLGLPEPLLRHLLRWTPVERCERFLRPPVVAWLLGVGALWLWHLPALYDATLKSENVHIVEHVMFLVTGTIFWWPVFTPLTERRMPPWLAMAYLGLATVANGLLGILFALSTTPFYAPYAHPHDALGALALIRNQWGLSQLVDQQLGGACMWVLGSLIFLSAIIAVLARWYCEERFAHDT